jgi:hypothetical protein
MTILTYLNMCDDVFYDDNEALICDICEEYYCYDCSYTFSIHYQHEGMRCYLCADQSRRKILDKRDSKIDYILRK